MRDLKGQNVQWPTTSDHNSSINWLSQKVVKFLGNWFYYPCRHEFNRKSARSHIAIICLLQSLIFLSFHFFFAKFGTSYTANSKLFINIFPARCKNICNVHIFRLLSNDIQANQRRVFLPSFQEEPSKIPHNRKLQRKRFNSSFESLAQGTQCLTSFRTQRSSTFYDFARFARTDSLRHGKSNTNDWLSLISGYVTE